MAVNFPKHPSYQSYFDQLCSISDLELFDGLLGYGLFTEKLPPVFTSVNFLYYVNNNNPSFSNKSSFYFQYESMRDVNHPRLFGIPTPFSYTNLCLCLRNNWKEILDHYRINTIKHNHKISRIHARKMNNTNSIFQMDYKNWKVDGSPIDELPIGNTYFVEADISTFFPSIYTHSIPWAIAGKTIAKQNKTNTACWYNDLDLYLRNCQDKETKGILIGPHTSNIISEIILVCVDNNLYNKGYKFIRNIDDYKCYVETRTKGEDFLRDLRDELKKFNLTLNHKKTTIMDYQESFNNDWTRVLSSFNLDSKGYINYKVIKRFLELAIDISSNQNKFSPIKYALKILCEHQPQITNNGKLLLQKITLQLASIFPYIIPLLDDLVFIPTNIDVSIIHEWCTSELERQISLRNYEAASFILYYGKKYKLKLPITITLIDEIITYNDSILLTLTYYYCLHMSHIFNLKKELAYLIKHAKSLNNDIYTMESNWVFVYESLSAKFLKNDWKKLKNNRVSFFE